SNQIAAVGHWDYFSRRAARLVAGAPPCRGRTLSEVRSPGRPRVLRGRGLVRETGHIVRSRIHSDRRIVTLHSTPGVQTTAEAFEAFLSEMCTTSEAYLRDLPS
ncbi:hypothetical protein ACFRCR_01335, partial [Oerskovia sp. NPDC056781]